MGGVSGWGLLKRKRARAPSPHSIRRLLCAYGFTTSDWQHTFITWNLLAFIDIFLFHDVRLADLTHTHNLLPRPQSENWEGVTLLYPRVIQSLMQSCANVLIRSEIESVTATWLVGLDHVANATIMNINGSSYGVTVRHPPSPSVESTATVHQHAMLLGKRLWSWKHKPICVVVKIIAHCYGD